MQLLRPGSEAEMIAQFLQQEYASADRYGARIRDCLQAARVDAAVITNPDSSNETQNASRRRVLGLYRGYGAGQASYLTEFPTEGVAWWWVALTPEELLGSRYIRYEYWARLSAGTRSPREAAKRIRSGRVRVDASGFLDLAERLRNGLRVPPLILVSADEGETRVVLEGHTRLTAYALAPESIPPRSEAMLGMSPAISNWDEY